MEDVVMNEHGMRTPPHSGDACAAINVNAQQKPGDASNSLGNAFDISTNIKQERDFDWSSSTQVSPNAGYLNMDIKQEPQDDCNHSTNMGSINANVKQEPEDVRNSLTEVNSVTQEQSAGERIVKTVVVFDFNQGVSNRCSKESLGLPAGEGLSTNDSAPCPDLSAEYDSATRDKPYECGVCTALFHHEVDFKSHSEWHTAQNPVHPHGAMSEQEIGLVTPDSVRQVGTQAEEETFTCDICQKSFAQEGSMWRHRAKAHVDYNLPGERPYKCDLCGKAFLRPCHLKAHVTTHSGEPPHKCDVCHPGPAQERPFKCDVCKKSFKGLQHLSAHLIEFHDGENPHKCDVCEKRFRRRSDRDIHKRTHTDGKPYQCDACERAFRRPCHLAAHMRTHSGGGPLKCNVCHKSFDYKSQFSQHISIHTGERPFKCELCEKSFKRGYNLTAHIETHSGEKPHKCDVCDKAFKRPSDRDIHLRTHTGEQPYKCEICKKKFTVSSSLSQHKKIHTREKNFQCDICKKSFTQSSTLGKHKMTHAEKTLV